MAGRLPEVCHARRTTFGCNCIRTMPELSPCRCSHCCRHRHGSTRVGSTDPVLTHAATAHGMVRCHRPALPVRRMVAGPSFLHTNGGERTTAAPALAATRTVPVAGDTGHRAGAPISNRPSPHYRHRHPANTDARNAGRHAGHAHTTAGFERANDPCRRRWHRHQHLRTAHHRPAREEPGFRARATLFPAKTAALAQGDTRKFGAGPRVLACRLRSGSLQVEPEADQLLPERHQRNQAQLLCSRSSTFPHP